MKELSLREIHNLQLDLLDYFHKFCTENSLHYFVAYGTLLGAIRHGGFIPWDDDVDVCLPREDYEKLLKLMHSNRQGRYVLRDHSKDETYQLPFAKLIDTKTIIDEYPSKNMNLGIFIDVFPLDLLPRKKVDRELRIMRNRLLFYMLYLKNRRPLSITNLRLFIEEKVLKPVLSIISPQYLINQLNYTMKNIKDKSDLCCVAVHSTVANKIYFYSKMFPMQEHNFENIKVNVPYNWHEYLLVTYGDYMTPPPENERTLRHNTKAWMVE